MIRAAEYRWKVYQVLVVVSLVGGCLLLTSADVRYMADVDVCIIQRSDNAESSGRER
jgi:hypothetical protein